MKAHHKG